MKSTPGLLAIATVITVAIGGCTGTPAKPEATPIAAPTSASLPPPSSPTCTDVLNAYAGKGQTIIKDVLSWATIAYIRNASESGWTLPVNLTPAQDSQIQTKVSYLLEDTRSACRVPGQANTSAESVARTIYHSNPQRFEPPKF